MAAVPTPRPRWLSPPLAPALVAAAGLAAAGLTPGPPSSQLPVSPDPGTPGGEGPASPAARLATIDVDPLGRHGLRGHVALEAAGGEDADGLEVRVQPVDGAGGTPAAAERGPVTVPAQDRRSADVHLAGRGSWRTGRERGWPWSPATGGRPSPDPSRLR